MFSFAAYPVWHQGFTEFQILMSVKMDSVRTCVRTVLEASSVDVQRDLMSTGANV